MLGVAHDTDWYCKKMTNFSSPKTETNTAFHKQTARTLHVTWARHRACDGSVIYGVQYEFVWEEER